MVMLIHNYASNYASDSLALIRLFEPFKNFTQALPIYQEEISFLSITYPVYETFCFLTPQMQLWMSWCLCSGIVCGCNRVGIGVTHQNHFWLCRK